MSAAIQTFEKNILASAFHSDVLSFADAENKLEGTAPGSFLTFSFNQQNYCSAVGRDGKILNNPFRLDASGLWYNFNVTPYETEMDLLNHLVDGQEPIPFYSDI